MSQSAPVATIRRMYLKKSLLTGRLDKPRTLYWRQICALQHYMAFSVNTAFAGIANANNFRVYDVLKLDKDLPIPPRSRF